MNDNEINVRVTANAGEVAPGMAQADSVVTRFSDRWRAQFQRVRSETAASMQDVKAQVVSSVQAVAGSFGGLVEVLATTQAGLIAVGVAAGLLGGSKAVAATAEMTESAMDLARSLGTTTNEASALSIAMADIGAPVSELQGAANGLSRQLRENEADMNKLGLKTRDASGNFRPMNELVLDGIEVLNGYAAGADRNVVAQELFGRGIDASSKLLLLNRGVVDEARQAQKELGLEVGNNSVKAWEAFDAATDRAGFSVQGMVKAVGDSLMPVLTDLVRLFNAVMPTAITIVRGALSGLTAVFLGLKNAAVIAFETINAAVITLAEPIRAMAETFSRALVGDFVGAEAAMKAMPKNIGDAWDTAFDRIMESSEETASKLEALFLPDTAPGSGGGKDGGATAPAGLGKKEKAPSRMPEFELRLDEERRLATERDAIHGMSKQAEQAFWDSVLATERLSQADRVSVARKAAQARIAVLQQEAREAAALASTSIEDWRDAAMHRVEMDAIAARQRVDLGQQTQAQLLQQELVFEDRRRAIALAALQAQQSQINPERDPVRYAQISAQIEELERQHQQRLAQIRAGIAVESAARMNAIWQDLGDRVSGLWDKGVDAMMNGTLTWRNATKAVGAELVGWMAGIVKQQIALHVLGEQGKTAATATGTAQRLLMEGWAAAKSIGIWAATAIKNILNSAWEAMAGAYKAIVGIPYVGPVLAPIAAGAAFAGVAAIAGNIASASGGYDIPAGVNPMTQLHQREMVLPAAQADVIRDMADGGGAGGGRPLNIAIHAVDAQGVERLLMNNGAALSKAVQRALRDNRFGRG